MSGGAGGGGKLQTDPRDLASKNMEDEIFSLMIIPVLAEWPSWLLAAPPLNQSIFVLLMCWLAVFAQSALFGPA